MTMKSPTAAPLKTYSSESKTLNSVPASQPLLLTASPIKAIQTLANDALPNVPLLISAAPSKLAPAKIDSPLLMSAMAQASVVQPVSTTAQMMSGVTAAVLTSPAPTDRQVVPGIKPGMMMAMKKREGRAVPLKVPATRHLPIPQPPQCPVSRRPVEMPKPQPFTRFDVSQYTQQINNKLKTNRRPGETEEKKEAKIADPFQSVMMDHNYSTSRRPTPPAPPPQLTPPLTSATSTAALNGALSASPYAYGSALLAMRSQRREEDATSAVSSGRGREAEPEGEETETAPEGEGDEDSVTRCICDFIHDDGYMICCDKCFVWQHVDCMGIDRARIPDDYLCERCKPRHVDRARARALQLRKRDELLANTDTSSDSSSSQRHRRTGASLTATSAAKKRAAAGVGGRRKSSGAGAPPAGKRARRESSARETSAVATPTGVKPKAGERRGSGGAKRQIKRRKSSKSGAEEPESPPAPACLPPAHVRTWVDQYEEAVTNHYSPELRARLASVRVNGAHSAGALAGAGVHRCRVTMIAPGVKVLVTNSQVSANQPLIELRGKHMLAAQHRPPALSAQRARTPTPFLFFYRLPKDGTEVCVDARTYGNDARFVRRSCRPNAELCHCIEKGTLHLYLVATRAIDRHAEITIRHDKPAQPGDVAAPVACACGTPRDCAQNTARRNNGAHAAVAPPPPPKTRERPERRGRAAKPAPVTPPTPPPPPPAPVVEPVVVVTPPPPAPPTPPPPPPPVVVAPTPPTPQRRNSALARAKQAPPVIETKDEDDDEEEDDEPETPVKKERKPKDTGSDCKKTREERKLEAIMKAFERMDRERQRKEENQNKNARRKTPRKENPPPLASRNDEDGEQEVAQQTKTAMLEKPKRRRTLHLPIARRLADFDFDDSASPEPLTDEQREEEAVLGLTLLSEPLHLQTSQQREDSQATLEGVVEALLKRRFESRPVRAKTGVKPPIPPKSNGVTRKRFRNDVQPKSYVDLSTDEEPPLKRQTVIAKRPNEKKMFTKQHRNTRRALYHDASESEESLAAEEEEAVRLLNRWRSMNMEGEVSSTDEEAGELVEGRRRAPYANYKHTRKGRGRANSAATTPTPARRTRQSSEQSNASSNDDDSAQRNMGPPNIMASYFRRKGRGRTLSAASAPPPRRRTRFNSAYSDSDEDEPDTPDEQPSAYAGANNGHCYTPPLPGDKLSNMPIAGGGVNPTLFSALHDSGGSATSSGSTPPTTLSSACLLVAAAVGPLAPGFKFPKTKKGLMNEWLNKSPDFPPTPSPTLPHFPSLAGAGEAGSAKKRWLRQAISEECDSPPTCAATPLKKRRLARESINSEESFTPPTTPTDQLPSPTPGNNSTQSPSEEDDPGADEEDSSAAPARGDCEIVSAVGAGAEDSPSLDQDSEMSITERVDEMKRELLAEKAEADLLDGIKEEIKEEVKEEATPKEEAVAVKEETLKEELKEETCSKEEEAAKSAKRKLSISEYRQRKQLADAGSSDAPADSGATGSRGASPRRRRSKSSSSSSSLSDDDMPTPELPLFLAPGTVSAPADKRGGRVQWSPAPTLVERQRENLTERLKREFGLFLGDDPATETNAAKTGLIMDLYDKDGKRRLPPSPPPPPHLSATTNYISTITGNRPNGQPYVASYTGNNLTLLTPPPMTATTNQNGLFDAGHASKPFHTVAAAKAYYPQVSREQD